MNVSGQDSFFLVWENSFIINGEEIALRRNLFSVGDVNFLWVIRDGWNASGFILRTIDCSIKGFRCALLLLCERLLGKRRGLDLFWFRRVSILE